ncbi:hypothetical protein M0802_002309 [Mischocyttarus mexicanus]|nr:hypothetical protein M0802_002309 [Mischocyttarus mexicanus]
MGQKTREYEVHQSTGSYGAGMLVHPAQTDNHLVWLALGYYVITVRPPGGNSLHRSDETCRPIYWPSASEQSPSRRD